MILIDPGHGGKDPGAVAFGVKEKDWTLEVSLYQYKRLKALGVPVLLTRDKDVTLIPAERTALVRNSGAVYCISNHFNAGGGTGCEAIYSIFSNDCLARKIGEALEASGMPLRRVFNRKGSGGKDYYYMHRETGHVKTVIIEYGFLDSEHDFNKLDTIEERRRYAEAVVKVMCEWVGVPYREAAVQKGEEPETSGLYKVQVGAFRERTHAERFAAELKKKGIEGFIVRE
ncbi:N-acetylmuramoyl-L-alanine amidase [Bacillus taeanensis]|uniref:N-acetylmuramoyl-L-alanine amidase n=1 Tax=Bacillus taeanensis TaxID=273032 RepID=A0A366XMF9_9BACI|nr:N-acetylmuramoyl-L-alanine amidase [Bacillus taeanensis]RBW67312.1 N-acetylmuramoyl-L-alanine amidase [Bacillus taeanensis]